MSPHTDDKALVCRIIDTPVGRLKLAAGTDGLAAVLWDNENPGRVILSITGEDPVHPTLVEAEQQLREYFAGQRTRFSLPLDFRGTPFQKQVWALLLDIPYGETRSYAQIASALGDRNAVRAVGAANGRNPISIIAACHRVIGSDGRLTGYAGGLPAKAWLLDFERRHQPGTQGGLDLR